MTDPTITALARELETKGAVHVEITAAVALQLVGLVQLALRHPDVSAGVRRTGEHFLAVTRGYFADCPTVLEIMQRGNDPHEDQPADPAFAQLREAWVDLDAEQREVVLHLAEQLLAVDDEDEAS